MLIPQYFECAILSWNLGMAMLPKIGRCRGRALLMCTGGALFLRDTSESGLSFYAGCFALLFRL